jgi:aminomethyltransferase
MSQQTPLHDLHLAAGARMVDFGGWRMPLHYGSQLDEHHAVRSSTGMFDVSHMTIVDVTGAQGREFLARLLANDPGKLAMPGQGLYSCMLNEAGGVIDDLIAYRLPAGGYRLVLNASTRERDLGWLATQAAGLDAGLEHRAGRVMLAVQGPAAVDTLKRLFTRRGPQIAALAGFHSLDEPDLFVARTGYTGEDGFELVLPAEAGCRLWTRLLDAGVRPCGLGARDTLRMEAGLSLYGQDMDEHTTPLDCGLGWTVAWSPPERRFMGREALEAQRAAGERTRLVGLLLEDRGIMRHGQRVLTTAGEGVVTSGGYSPTMERSIAMARIPAATAELTHCTVEIRGASKPARIVRLPFVRRGRVLVQ